MLNLGLVVTLLENKRRSDDTCDDGGCICLPGVVCDVLFVTFHVRRRERKAMSQSQPLVSHLEPRSPPDAGRTLGPQDEPYLHDMPITYRCIFCSTWIVR